MLWILAIDDAERHVYHHTQAAPQEFYFPLNRNRSGDRLNEGVFQAVRAEHKDSVRMRLQLGGALLNMPTGAGQFSSVV